MDDLIANVREIFPDARLDLVERLIGSKRSLVARVLVDGRSLIVKQYVGGDGDGWARERAALSILPDDAPAPKLVATSALPPIVVMTDIGGGPSVAKALLGRDPTVAAEAMASWATSLATLHRQTRGSRGAFRGALNARFPESTVLEQMEDAAEETGRHCAALGVDLPGEAVAELVGLADRLNEDGPAALTPADACPDNNVRTPDGGLVLIDFEGSQWRHVAWDVAYLAVPWPTCWCAWRLPEEAVDDAIRTYRSAAGGTWAQSPAFHTDVAAAVVGWTYVSVSWFLARALADDAALTATPDKPSPPRRATILHRLDVARRADAGTPALAGLADRLHRALTDRWGECPLPSAPAFRA